jgi:tetratricopeptide (TPR) repeat protein
LHGADAASRTSSEIIRRFGDSAAVHMRIGRVYALSGFPDRAIEEFKKAVARDYKMPDVHYSLGAAYMSNLASQLPLAKEEFRKELELHPDDAYSYPQLGYIALGNLDYHEAEVDFHRAIAANPMNAQVFANLGKLYVATGRTAEAEAAFRQAVTLTLDPSRNEYAIERVHYQLGRLLLARGKEAEGQRELQIAQELLSQRDTEAESKLNGKSTPSSPLEKTRVATAKDLQELKVFIKQVGPLIAGSYNNLGVHAAISARYSEAAGYFQLAARWNPALRGVDRNWGMADFAARNCREAIEPLRRAVAADSSNTELATMLTECQTVSARQ